jgi:hypothetical protein
VFIVLEHRRREVLHFNDEELDLLRRNGGRIAYALKRIGIDYVGIASDFNHGGDVAG